MTAAATSRAVTPEITTETISDYQAFLDLEPDWNRVVEDSWIDHPFLEHAWLRTWWECFGEGSTIHIVVVSDGDEIQAIAPLILTKTRMFGIPVRRLGFFYNSHVPRAGFIVRKRAEDAYKAIWVHLLREQRLWDLLQLCQLPVASSTLHEMRSLASEAGFPNDVWRSGESPYVSLDASWRDYYGNLATKHRSNLRNRFKRLNEIGPVELETVARQNFLTEDLEAGLRLEESAWKRDAGTAISCDPRVRNFYESFARRAAEKNWLRLNFLKADTQRVAFDYSLAYQQRVFLLKLGYDPAFSAYSPSNLLLALALERAFDEDFSKYDFLGESADWKRCWTKDAMPNYWLFVFADSLKGRWLHRVKFRMNPWLKKLLGKEAK
jgi:CelD/BcsL family acetyltransferase involved in cellulose biosynthesis